MPVGGQDNITVLFQCDHPVILSLYFAFVGFSLLPNSEIAASSGAMASPEIALRASEKSGNYGPPKRCQLSEWQGIGHSRSIVPFAHFLFN